MGSNPIRVVIVKLHINFTNGILAQLGEHLPYKQRVIGSSPIGPINQFYIDYAGVAELADAQDLKSCGTNLPYRFDSGRRHCLKVEETLINTAFPLFLHKGNDVLPWVEIPKPHLMLMTSVYLSCRNCQFFLQFRRMIC